MIISTHCNSVQHSRQSTYGYYNINFIVKALFHEVYPINMQSRSIHNLSRYNLKSYIWRKPRSTTDLWMSFVNWEWLNRNSLPTAFTTYDAAFNFKTIWQQFS